MDSQPYAQLHYGLPNHEYDGDTIPQERKPALGSPDRNSVRVTVQPHSRSPPLSRPFGQTGFQRHLGLWAWEAGASFLAVASLVAIAATVYPYSGRPIPQWPLGISVNALLSVYSTILKAAIGTLAAACIGQLQWTWFSSSARPLHDLVLYDQAGRGVWGSLRLIGSRVIRDPLAACIAVLVVMTVALEPMVQQMINVVDCIAVSESHTARIPRTNVYRESPVGSELESVLDSGFYTTGARILAECSTGNCTFPVTYSSLGYCSSCEDISAKLSFSQTCVSAGETAWPSTLDLPGGCPKGLTPNITSSLPSRYDGMEPGLSVSFAYNGVDDQTQDTEVCAMSFRYDEQYHAERLHVEIIAGKTTFSEAGLNATNGKALAGCDTRDSQDTWRCRGYGAANCTLQPCVRFYNATVLAGSLSETILGTSDSTPWENNLSGPMLGIIDLQCTSRDQKENLARQGHNVESAGRWIAFNNITMTDLKMSLESSGCLYEISFSFAASVFPYFMQEYLSGSVFATGERLQNDPPPATTMITHFGGSAIVKRIYNYGQVDLDHVQDTFSGVADALTTYIRTHGNANHSEPAAGQVLHYAACLEVRWGWLAFPAALTGLMLALSLGVVVSTTKQRTPVWKASVLPWIYRGPGSLAREESRTGDTEPTTTDVTTEGMAESARRVMVALGDKADPRVLVVEQIHKGVR